LTAAGILGGAGGGFALLMLAAIRRWFGGLCCYANRNTVPKSRVAHAHGAFIAARPKRIMP
jgi:hypothetical protein